MKKRIIALLLVSVLCLTALIGCGKKNGPTSVAIRIGDLEVTKEELLYYYAYYETIGTIYGLTKYETAEEFWKSKNDEGVTFREFYYTSLFAELTYMTIMGNLAEKEGIKLTDSEKAAADKDAEEFFNDFTDKEKKKSGITLNGFKIALERQVLVGKYETILQSKFELDEDLIKSLYDPADYPSKKTEYISVSLVDSKNVPLSGDALDKALANLATAEEKFKAGTSAEDVAKQFKDTFNLGYGTRYLCAKSDFEKEYISSADALNEGEFTSVIKTETRAYVVKMLDTNSPDYYNYLVESAIQGEADKKMSEYYEKTAVSYTRTIVNKIINVEQFGTFVLDPASLS